MGVYLGVVMRRLRAEGAILRTIPSLAAYDRAEKYPVALVFKGNFPGKGNEVRQIRARQLMQLERLFKRYRLFFYKEFFGYNA